MLFFKRKEINFLVYFLVIFSVFSQNQNDEFDFLDKIDNLKKKETLKVEKKKTPLLKKKASNQVKKQKKTKIKKKKTVQNSIEKPIEKPSFWIDEKLNLSPYFQEFGFQVISEKENIVQNKKDVYQKKELVLDVSDSAEKITITDWLQTKVTEFKENFESMDIVDVMIEYKKAIIIVLLIILFTFLRNKYMTKSPKSMIASKKSVISNKFLDKGKY